MTPLPALPTVPASPQGPARSPSRRGRVGAAATGAAVLVLLPVTAASAHVHVEPEGTAAGSSTQLVLRVPDESDTARTTQVTVHLPTATPFTLVSVEAMPGWTAQVHDAALPHPVRVGGATITTAPATVVWTADAGGGLAPGQYGLFTITAGPLPREGTHLELPVDQGASDGTVVHWDQPTPASGQEPEHPVPTLTTTRAVAGGDDDDPAPTAAAAAASGGSPGSRSGDRSDAPARWLGGGGLVLGAAALVVALLRGRRPAAAGA